MSEFHTLLRFLRKLDMSDGLSEENVHILMKFGDEYEIQSVLADCSSYILANWKKDPEKHLKAVSLASQYGLKSLIKGFVPLAAMRSLEEISALAPTMASNVFAAILYCRFIQQQQSQQNTTGAVLECYPVCVIDHGQFQCESCDGTDSRCATGLCIVNATEVACYWCGSTATKPGSQGNGNCDNCKAAVPSGRLCGCDKSVEKWLENEVVVMLLKRKA